MDVVPNMANHAQSSSQLPPKQHLPPPTSAAEIDSQMTEIFKALNPEDRRYHYSRLTTTLRQNLLTNAQNALHCNKHKHTSRAKFTIFNNLPAEIRTRIWRMAADASNIVELESYTSKHGNQEYRPLDLPSTLLACHESHQEALLNVRLNLAADVANDVLSSNWLKYNIDILHLRDMDFSERGAYVFDANYDPLQDQIRRTNSSTLHIRTAWESDKWEGRPACFEEIEALAISRDLLVRTLDPYECIIRHFFPRLRILIVLIDDAIDIDDI